MESPQGPQQDVEGDALATVECVGLQILPGENLISGVARVDDHDNIDIR